VRDDSTVTGFAFVRLAAFLKAAHLDGATLQIKKHTQISDSQTEVSQLFTAYIFQIALAGCGQLVKGRHDPHLVLA
jgi:hypothetical protein